MGNLSIIIKHKKLYHRLFIDLPMNIINKKWLIINDRDHVSNLSKNYEE